MWLLAVLVLSLAPVAWAETVCRVISTGQIAETYSTTQRAGQCQANLATSGIAASEVEQLTVDAATRRAMLDAWYNNPANPDKVKRDAAVDPDAELAAAIKAVDTSTILDPAAKASVEQLKNALLGTTRKGKVKAANP